ncbi:hypothetical protein [Streptomyces rishiriensis]|uniref:Uncharacterized protein n=1 Tax=Streptomyces rishiriensis TaxID=68264 RepID=A0ABU0NI05_STRRH|nr:hypothetical protein [Streptomyces rishiriensis]MDQ0578700.1 hypothetical protein [Streptomyces rishiriensis]
MKPHAVHLQLHGKLAVVTLCATRPGAVRRDAAELADALAALPERTVFLILDLDHADGLAADGLVAVLEWARAHAVFVAVLDGPAGPGAFSACGVAATTDSGPQAAPRAFRRGMQERDVVHLALGIRHARRDAHPCAGL